MPLMRWKVIAAMKRDSNPFFSVIMPARNAGKYLHRSIGSVLTQTCGNFELLIIVNHSQDNSLKIAKAFSAVDKRIHTIEIAHAGISNARNVGIRNASGRYFVFLDADDSLMPWALEDMHRVLTQKCFGTPVLITSGNGWMSSAERVECNERCFFESAEKLYVTSLAAEKYQETLNFVLRNHPRIRRVLTPPWGKAFNREFIEENGIYFDLRCPIYEDAVFNQLVFSACSEPIPILISDTYCYQNTEGSFSRRRGLDFIRDGLQTVEVYIQKANSNDGIMKSIISYNASFFLYCTLLGGLRDDHADQNTSAQENNKKLGYDLAGSFLERKDVIECLREAQKIQCPPEKAWLGEKAVPWMIGRNFEKLLSKRLF